jgi:hypothetical protein
LFWMLHRQLNAGFDSNKSGMPEDIHLDSKMCFQNGSFMASSCFSVSFEGFAYAARVNYSEGKSAPHLGRNHRSFRQIMQTAG